MSEINSNLKTGYIYKIFNSVSSDIYIRSTFNAVRKRFSQHKSKFKFYKNGKCHKNGKFDYTTSYKLFEEDYNNVKWGILEEVKVSCKKDLQKIERKYIENNNCVNKVIPTRKEYEYREANKDKRAKRNNKKIKCEFCKCSTMNKHLRRHQRSKKCKKAQNKQ